MFNAVESSSFWKWNWWSGKMRDCWCPSREVGRERVGYMETKGYPGAQAGHCRSLFCLTGLGSSGWLPIVSGIFTRLDTFPPHPGFFCNQMPLLGQIAPLLSFCFVFSKVIWQTQEIQKYIDLAVWNIQLPREFRQKYRIHGTWSCLLGFHRNTR